MSAVPAIWADHAALSGNPGKVEYIPSLFIGMAPCPCDDCLHQARCRTGLACWDFVVYVNSGRLVTVDRTPRREIFERTMG